MPRRRRPVTRTREQVRTLFSNAIEALESRTLFDTIGLDQPSGIFEYKDGRNQIVRIRYHNVVAELVFARVDEDTNNVVLGNRTAPALDEDGKDLFHIYVAEAGPDSFITVAEVPNLDANTRPMQAFQGSVNLTIFGTEGIEGVSTAGGSGSIYLGARTRDTPANIADEADRPILTDNFNGLGILGPRPNGRLTAGLLVESGQDLGKFFWGGAISGQVYLGGSIDTFYCGALLTGDTRGQSTFSSPVIPENFVVEGDVRELIVMGSIGTHAGSNAGEPIYASGFDARIGGTIGRVQSYGSIFGNIRANNDPAAPRLRSSQREVENKVQPGNRGSLTHFEGTDRRDLSFFDFDPEQPGQPRLGDNQGEFLNDAIENAQFLGVIDSKSQGNNVIDLQGRIQNTPQIGDQFDHYAVALTAGQQISVRLISDFGSIQVFDPDGRLIASDENNLDLISTLNQEFVLTADRPGIYRFRVNATVAGTTILGTVNYRLTMKNVGEMTIGAVVAENEIYDEAFDVVNIHAANGDLGAVFAGGTIGYESFVGSAPDIFVDNGSLRAVDGAQIGLVEDQRGEMPNLRVTGGNIGHIRARTSFVNIEGIVVKDRPDSFGGDLQLIESPNSSLYMALEADGGLGVARANNMATFAASIISLNVDERGSDGILDLIDVSGDLGELAAGGPQITTGPGGNVRYIHVGGQAFRDVFFGGGSPDITNYAPGERVNFIDDSGTQMTLTPTDQRRVNIDGSITTFGQGSLTTVAYPIRFAGGSVLINLTSSTGVEIGAGGQSASGTAEISTIEANGIGTVIVENEGNSVLSPLDDRLQLATGGTNRNLDVTIQGNAVTDVYEIIGGNFNSIVNSTGGEIVNMTIGSVGELTATTLGLSKRHAGAPVEGNTIFAAGGDSPFVQQRIGIQVNGDIVSAMATQGLGNFIVNGTIQEMIANGDGRGTSGVHEGINAPILTQPGGVAEGGGGGIREINIGEGILPGGSGEMNFGGIFATGRIGEIVGVGADIRGDIVSKGQNLPTITITLPNGTTQTTVPSPIGTIALNNGSIVGADILVVSTFTSAREYNPLGTTVPNFGGLSGEPVYEIGTIALNGNGGIIGSLIGAADIQDVIVSGGFGIFSTAFASLAQGELRSIVTDGFGLRSSSYQGGGAVDAIVVNGRGNKLATTNYSAGVRFSEKGKFDPFSGLSLNEFNDLHRFLGTSKDAPIRTTTAVSKSGIIDNFRAVGARELGVMQAQQIKNSFLNFGGGTNQIIARDLIDALAITSGRLNFVSTKNDLARASFSIAGPIGTIDVGGTIRGTSRIAAVGPNGQITTINVGKSLWGTITSTNDIAQINVKGDYGSQGAFNLDGERISAGIDVGRNLQNFIVGGSILTDSNVFVDDNLGLLDVGGDIQENATIDVQTLGTQQVDGEIFGDIIIRAD